MPITLVAVTVKRTGTPPVSPLTSAVVEAPATVTAEPDGRAVTVYEVTGTPPSSTGAAHETRMASSRTLVTTAVGAPGGSASRTHVVHTTVSVAPRTVRSRQPRGVPADTPSWARISWPLTTVSPVTDTPGPTSTWASRGRLAPVIVTGWGAPAMPKTWGVTATIDGGGCATIIESIHVRTAATSV